MRIVRYDERRCAVAKKDWQKAEKEILDALDLYADDVRIQPGSGNKWGARGDIRAVDEEGTVVMVSVKSTVRDSISVSKKIVKEIEKIAMEQGDGEYILALHFNKDQKPLAVVPLIDYLEARYG